MTKFLRYRVLVLLCMALSFGLVFAGVTQAMVPVPVITVSDPFIDETTGGNFVGTYGECFFLLPNPNFDQCEEEVGPNFYNPGTGDQGLEYRSPDSTCGGSIGQSSNVCFGNGDPPVASNTLSLLFDIFRVDNFRVFRIDNSDPDNPVEDTAFAWSTIAEPDGGQWKYIPCPSDLKYDENRFTTFDSEFPDDTAVSEVIVDQTGSITLTYYFVNAQDVCRVLKYELFINGISKKTGKIGDFESGKYLVFEVAGLTGETAIRLETTLTSDPLLTPTTCGPAAPIPGVNAHISGVFIDNCVPKPASLGDRVWEDLNGNGLQDCRDANGNGVIGDAGDIGPECRAGIPRVTVDLVNCRTGDVLDTTFTDASGFYLFDNLIPGVPYCVQFDLNTVPADVCAFGALQFTIQNAGDDAWDSDPAPNTGISPPVVLGEGETNLTVDAGIVCQECAITIDKKCRVEQPAPGPFECDGKVDALKMIWNGPGTLTSVNALPGGDQSFPKVTITDEGGLQVVTVVDYQPSTNDVIWQWVSDSASGQSKFHLSCSDSAMNGPEDCGMPQGDGKNNEAAYDNIWLLDGLATDKGFVLDCTPQPAEGTDQCSFEASPVPGCKTDPAVNDLKSITFRYTGAECSASDNGQGAIGDKWDCSGSPGVDPVSIGVIKDSGKTRSDKDQVGLGDTFTVGDDFSSETILSVGGQTVTFHASCSQPLAVGDVFGSLEVVGINGLSPGAEVTYSYEVKNIGDDRVDVTSVFDDQLGELLEKTVTLEPDESITLKETAFISETTTNVATAKANLFATDRLCDEARDKVTVTVTEPTCDVAIVLDRLEDDKIKWKITNTSKIVATLQTLTVNFPDGDAGYGFIKEIKLDGGIFKKDDSDDYPYGLPSAITVGAATDWTNPDLTKRQLDPGETRTLEVVFTQKSKGEGWVDIGSAGTAGFEEGCSVELIGPSGCEIGKPTALVFTYTGDDCWASNNSQDSGKWSCSGDPAGVEPVQIVMTKDADKFIVEPSTNTIGIGDTFEIRMKEGSKEFPADIKFDIRNGTTLQSLSFHTSCSQTLSVGDQFGSVIVTEFFPKN